MQRNNILNSVEYRTNPFIPPILYPVGQTNKIIVLYTLDNQCIKTVSTMHINQPSSPDLHKYPQHPAYLSWLRLWRVSLAVKMQL